VAAKRKYEKSEREEEKTTSTVKYVKGEPCKKRNKEDTEYRGRF
jgi:hypothetical protein